MRSARSIFRPFLPTRRSLLKGTGAAVIGMTFLPRTGLSEEDRKLNFYNWDSYVGETTLADFQDATGIETHMDFFADNDELFAKLKQGNPGYDVIVPSHDYVEQMIQAGLLLPLDHDRIPNIANLEARFLDADFDPKRRYSMPYTWGTACIGYRKSKVSSSPDSWKYLYDSPQYAGRIALLGNGRDVIGLALKYLGYSYNSTDPDAIRQAEELIIANKKNIKVFADDNGQDLLASGEVDLAQEWNGDVIQVMEEDDDVGMLLPKEGTALWEDSLCIPKGAPHPVNAHVFINFLLGAEVGAAIADYLKYATPNAAAKKLLGSDYLDNPAIFPSQEVLDRCEVATYLGRDLTRLYDEAWTRINAA